MSGAIILALLIIGILFLLLEILVIPGTGIVGILGFLSVATGIYFAYKYNGNLYGHITVVATLSISILSIVYSLKSKTWEKLTLKSDITSKVNTEIDESGLTKGDTGLTISRLAPSGKAKINKNYYEVQSTGIFIDENSEIEITKIETNKIYVKQIIKT